MSTAAAALRATLLGAALLLGAPMQANADDHTVFHAALDNDLARAAELIARGADVNARHLEEYRVSALHITLIIYEARAAPMVKLLIDAGGNVDQQARDGSTPRGIAAQIDDPTINALMESVPVREAGKRGELWGAYAESGCDYAGQHYGVGWNFSAPAEAAEGAVEACTDAGGDAYHECGGCAEGLYVFSTSLPESVGLSQDGPRADFAGHEGVGLIRARCILVTEDRYDTGGGDIVRMFYNSEEEARAAYEEKRAGRNTNLYVGEDLLRIACNEW